MIEKLHRIEGKLDTVLAVLTELLRRTSSSRFNESVEPRNAIRIPINSYLVRCTGCSQISSELIDGPEKCPQDGTHHWEDVRIVPRQASDVIIVDLDGKVEVNDKCSTG
jgi:hypothetical protein